AGWPRSAAAGWSGSCWRCWPWRRVGTPGTSRSTAAPASRNGQGTAPTRPCGARPIRLDRAGAAGSLCASGSCDPEHRQRYRRPVPGGPGLRQAHRQRLRALLELERPRLELTGVAEQLDPGDLVLVERQIGAERTDLDPSVLRRGEAEHVQQPLPRGEAQVARTVSGLRALGEA